MLQTLRDNHHADLMLLGGVESIRALGQHDGSDADVRRRLGKARERQ